MKEFESQRVKSALKTLLRQRAITYETLAELMECSVPTVTRFLGAEELTLSRLLKLCEILKIDLADLQNLIKLEAPEEEKFTPEQEQFLVKNRNYLAYLLRLFSNETPKQIAEKFQLTQRSTDKYLIGLERNELIRVTGKQKVKPAFKNLPTFGRGPLGKAYFETIVKNAGQFFIGRIHEDIVNQIEPRSPSGSKFSVSVLMVTKASFEAWSKEREVAERAFFKLASFEENTKPESELMTAVIYDARTLVPSNDPGLQMIENTFGGIPNL